MRITKGLGAAIIPAVLLTLAACSDTPEAPETLDVPTVSETVASGSGDGTAEATGTETTTAGTTEETTSEATQQETSGPAESDDIYTLWGGITECPSLEEINSITGLDIVGEEGTFDADLGLGCSYGDPMVATSPLVRIQSLAGAGTAPLVAADLEELLTDGIEGSVEPATNYGDQAFYLESAANAAEQMPPLCMLAASGENVAGEQVNVAIFVADPAVTDPGQLCNLVDHVAWLG